MRSESRSRSRSEKDRNFSSSTNPQQPPNKSLYVTFLPEDIDEDKLRQIFEEAGTIANLVLKKKDDGFTFAFVHYNTIDEATRAISQLNRKKVGSKFINVKYSKPREEQPRRDGNRESSSEKNFEGRGKKEFDSRKKFEGGDRQFNRGNRDSRPPRDDNRNGERKPMKCFKCHGEGHMSRNCPEDDKPRDYRDQKRDQGYSKKPEKMSEDEGFDDY